MEQILLTIATSILAAFITSILMHREIKRRAELDLQNQYATRFNEKKWTTYIEFINTVPQLFDNIHTNKRDGKEPNFSGLATALFLIGSDKVLLSFREWRSIYDQEGPSGQHSLMALFSLVIEMRKDLGNNKTELNYEDLLGSLVPNYMRSL